VSAACGWWCVTHVLQTVPGVEHAFINTLHSSFVRNLVNPPRRDWLTRVTSAVPSGTVSSHWCRSIDQS
jgi:hypothetical protein